MNAWPERACAHGWGLQRCRSAVRWNDEVGRYLIVSGERRWRATLKAGRKTIDAVIVDPRSESQILELQLVENCLSGKDPSPDRAVGQGVPDAGWTATDGPATSWPGRSI